jgi:monoamine oxidase
MQDGSVLEARYAIVCVPPHVMADHIEFSPALEEPRQKAIQGHMGGQILKVIAVFEQRFWNELDPKLCGSILSSQQEFNTIFDVSYGQYGILAGFVGHQHAESMRQLGKEATQRKFIDYLQKAYACNAPPIKSFHMYDWIGDQLAGGAFTARRKLGVWADTNFFDMTKPFCDRVMFAGTETAREWRGYIEGALESAERAIRQVELHLQTCATKQ